jgi:hypothetical protein
MDKLKMTAGKIGVESFLSKPLQAFAGLQQTSRLPRENLPAIVC